MPGKCPCSSRLSSFVTSMSCSPSLQGLGRIARREKAYREQLRKSFGGCLVSGKLQGFASEGRHVKKTPVGQDDPDKDLVGQLDMRNGGEDGWADRSDSDSYSDSDSDDNAEHASNDIGEEDDDVATAKGMAQGIFPRGDPNNTEETQKDAAPGSEPCERGACAGSRESSTSTPEKPSPDAKAKEVAMSIGDNGAAPPDIPVRSGVSAA